MCTYIWWAQLALVKKIRGRGLLRMYKIKIAITKRAVLAENAPQIVWRPGCALTRRGSLERYAA